MSEFSGKRARKVGPQQASKLIYPSLPPTLTSQFFQSKADMFVCRILG
jgi:hypothetical protein